MHTHTHTHTHTCMYARTRTRTNTHTHTCTHTKLLKTTILECNIKKDKNVLSIPRLMLKHLQNANILPRPVNGTYRIAVNFDGGKF